MKTMKGIMGCDNMEENNTWMDNVVELATSLAIGYAVSKIVRIALARGQSMVPTIKHNQIVLIDRTAYRRRAPRPNDLIAFNAHVKNQHKFFLKRVIAIEGDEVKIEAGQVFINGSLRREPYINEEMKDMASSQWIVPVGKLFVMGDNRNHSLDSRSDLVGFIDIKQDVLGVVKQIKK